jgi:hypothetical protein
MIHLQFNLPDIHPNSLLHAPDALLNPRGHLPYDDQVDGGGGHYMRSGGHYLPTSHNLGRLSFLIKFFIYLVFFFQIKDSAFIIKVSKKIKSK